MRRKEAIGRAYHLAFEHGLGFVDKTEADGCFWIVGGQELSTILGPAGFQFARRGGWATRHRPAWFLIPPVEPHRRKDPQRAARPVILSGGAFEMNHRKH